MLQDEQYIAKKLGIEDWDEDKKGEAVAEAMVRAGEAVLGDLSDAQNDEYTAIINDDHQVIDQWLEQNAQDYHNNPVYRSLAETVGQDPERNNPAKLFATMAWVQVNVPDAEERVQKALDAYKQEINAS